MKTIVVDHINKLFSNYEELVAYCPHDLLGRKLDITKSKTLGEHLWCVIGARESYARSLEEGRWVGFSSSLNRADIQNASTVLGHLRSSAKDARDAIEQVSEWNNERDELLLSLLQHETMHEGQIIRLVYGFGETLPMSWVDRWA